MALEHWLCVTIREAMTDVAGAANDGTVAQGAKGWLGCPVVAGVSDRGRAGGARVAVCHGDVGLIAAAVNLIGAVVSAVHQAEVVAHRVGEPFGTLVLAVAVTVIEVSLIVSLMVSGSGDVSALARDTVFAAIMIILTFIIGLCLLTGG